VNTLATSTEGDTVHLLKSKKGFSMKLSTLLLSVLLSTALVSLAFAKPTKPTLMKAQNIHSHQTDKIAKKNVVIKGKSVVIKGKNGSVIESDKQGKSQQMTVKSKSGNTVTKGKGGTMALKGANGAVVSKNKKGAIKIKGIGKTTVTGDAKKMKIKGPRGLKVNIPTGR
jgi:hypothetical protein